jgi:hypothetical protein
MRHSCEGRNPVRVSAFNLSSTQKVEKTKQLKKVEIALRPEGTEVPLDSCLRRNDDLKIISFIQNSGYYASKNR